MGLAIARAAYLNVYIAELRAIGAPVDRELARSRLPSWIEEMPDAFVSIPLALAMLGRAGHDFDTMDFGFRAAQRASLASLSQPMQRALREAPTGLKRVEAFVRLAAREDNVLATSMHLEGERVRAICDLTGFARHPQLCLAEWLNLQELISLVRSIAGSAWCPAEMTFISHHPPSTASQEAFPDTRILVGQRHTSIMFDSEILARSCPPTTAVPSPSRLGENGPNADSGVWSFDMTLRLMLRPYLADGRPDLSRIADIVGMSSRTLQRRLERGGCSYSDVVRHARFDLARDLLADPAARIIDVAMAAGYENPQHFSRAFRLIAGISPATYRRTVAAAPS